MNWMIAAGVVFAIFVGINIGGSSTGASFGPSVGANMVSKVFAGVLMTVFVFVGGWTIGRNVIHTLSEGIIPSSTLTLRAGVVVLFVIGIGLFIANIVGIPASTSETAVGAIAGLGVATGTLNWAVVGSIVILWVVSPVVAMGLSAAIGRFAYRRLERFIGVDVQLSEPVLDLAWDDRRPTVKVNTELTPRRFAIMGLTVAIGCYMAFSAGANNVANAVAPLVGEQTLRTNEAVLLATAAIGVGAFTLARRTLETVGNDLAELQLTAALTVEVIAATVIAILSIVGIPASLAITTTGSIIGLNWGREQRRVTETDTDTDIGTIRNDSTGSERSTADSVDTELIDTDTTRRTIFIWVATPMIASVMSFLIFALLL